jgi:hypothetical protein
MADSVRCGGAFDGIGLDHAEPAYVHVSCAGGKVSSPPKRTPVVTQLLPVHPPPDPLPDPPPLPLPLPPPLPLPLPPPLPPPLPLLVPLLLPLPDPPLPPPLPLALPLLLPLLPPLPSADASEPDSDPLLNEEQPAKRRPTKRNCVLRIGPLT